MQLYRLINYWFHHSRTFHQSKYVQIRECTVELTKFYGRDVQESSEIIPLVFHFLITAMLHYRLHSVVFDTDKC